MADNPLAGLSIPSISDIVEGVMTGLGGGIFDLSHPLQRSRLKKLIENSLRMILEIEVKHALQAATERAVAHVFKVMEDAEYQEKKRVNREKRRLKSMERKHKREEAEREARMDYSKKNLKVSKPTIQ